MSTFKYKAKKGPKEILEGSIEADSERAAVRQLTQSGLYLVSIKEKLTLARGKTLPVSLFSKRIRTKDLANFTGQLSELLDSGLTLYNSLNIIENQIEHPQLKEIIRNTRDSIKDGNTLSESLKAYPRIFSNLYINLVRSGEAGGMLNEVLANIAEFLEKQENTRFRIIAALAYPMLMGIVGIATIFILMAFVIPKLANMFVDIGEQLPIPTRMLIGLSDFLRSYWILLVLSLGGLIFFIKKSETNRVTKRAIDRLKLNLPIAGRLIRNTELARFSRSLSTLLKNGVPILKALKITSDIVENEVIKEQIVYIHLDVKAGFSLATAIKKNSSFPPFVVNMATIGEEGGFLDKILLKVAKSYENEIDREVKIMTSVLEPAMILIMGVIVGFIVISMLLPVFQISLVAY